MSIVQLENKPWGQCAFVFNMKIKKKRCMIQRKTFKKYSNKVFFN